MSKNDVDPGSTTESLPPYPGVTDSYHREARRVATSRIPRGRSVFSERRIVAMVVAFGVACLVTGFLLTRIL